MIKTRFNDTEVGRIPEDWDIIKLGDVVDISSGSTPSRYIESNFTGSTCWLTSGELKLTTFMIRKKKLAKQQHHNYVCIPKERLLLQCMG